MEWTLEEFEYIVPLDGVMVGILPSAPQNMKDFAINDLNKSNMAVYGYNIYVGLDAKKQRMLGLKNPIPIFQIQENRVGAYLPADNKVVLQWFPKYGIQIQDGYITKITESLREDMVLCGKNSIFSANRFNTSCLDVEGE